MKNSVRLISAALSIFMTLSLAACGTKNTSQSEATNAQTAVAESASQETAPATTAEKKEPVKLKAFLMYEDQARKDLHDKYYSVNVQKELPDFNVEFEIPGKGYLDKLKVYNSSGDMPDVYWGNDICAKTGNSLDLTDYINKDGFADKYTNKGALLPYKDGKLYAISAGTDQNFIPVVFYYKDIFEKLGLTVPKTFDELMAVGKKLKENKYIPLASPHVFALAGAFMQDLFLATDPQYVKDLSQHKAKFSDKVGLDAFKKMQELIKAGFFPKNMATIDYGGGMQLFKDKKAAMLYIPTWEVAGLAGDANVDFFPVPSLGADIDQNINIWGNPTNGFSVFTNSKHKDEAVKLAEWLVTQDAKFFITEQKSKVSIDVGIELKDVSPLAQKVFDRIAKAPNKTAVITLAGPTDALYQTNMSKMLVGGITPEEFAKQMDASYEKNDK